MVAGRRLTSPGVYLRWLPEISLASLTSGDSSGEDGLAEQGLLPSEVLPEPLETRPLQVFSYCRLPPRDSAWLHILWMRVRSSVPWPGLGWRIASQTSPAQVAVQAMITAA